MHVFLRTKCLHNCPDGYILNDRRDALTLENLISIVLFRMMIHKVSKYLSNVFT